MTHDRAAIVTGAARGLGAGIVARLLADGWRVGLVDVARVRRSSREPVRFWSGVESWNALSVRNVVP